MFKVARQPHADLAQQALDLASVQLNNLAINLAADGKVDTATVLLRRAVSLNSSDLQSRLNLAATVVCDGFLDEALALIADAPEDNYKTHLVRAFAAIGRNDLPAAIEHFATTDRLNPHGITERFGEGSTRLLSGDWARGWEDFEILMSQIKYGDSRRWDGGHVEQLLVVADQGAGDIINFARYIPWAAERAQRLIFAVPMDMFRLLHRYQKYGRMVTAHQGVTANAHIGLSGLPRLYGTLPDRMPRDPGLLHTDLVDGIAPRRKDRLRVGIAWAGNAKYVRDRWRSMPFRTMLGLAANSRVDLYSIQAGSRAADIVAESAQALVTDISGKVIHEWSCAAGALKQMDAVVTVDTAVAHLAGALGVKTYVCLPVLPDWRWLLGRTDTPWYPSVTLVRQERHGDWAGVIARIAALLA